jgi:hypothetical protein
MSPDLYGNNRLPKVSITNVGSAVNHMTRNLPRISQEGLMNFPEGNAKCYAAARYGFLFPATTAIPATPMGPQPPAGVHVPRGDAPAAHHPFPMTKAAPAAPAVPTPPVAPVAPTVPKSPVVPKTGGHWMVDPPTPVVTPPCRAAPKTTPIGAVPCKAPPAGVVSPIVPKAPIPAVKAVAGLNPGWDRIPPTIPDANATHAALVRIAARAAETAPAPAAPVVPVEEAEGGDDEKSVSVPSQSSTD